jgi:C4-dicarboxylate-specific signal transduction histidine kinase
MPVSALHEFLADRLQRQHPSRSAGSVEHVDRGWNGCDAQVTVDRNKLWDMVMNIIRNSQAALDFRRIDALRTAAAAPFARRIRITAGLDDRQAFLRITDTGGGVSPEAARKLYREPVTSRKRGRGRPGQGTVFVKFFGERMGIAVTAENTDELGEPGLAVTLSLPLQPPCGPAAERTIP